MTTFTKYMDVTFGDVDRSLVVHTATAVADTLTITADVRLVDPGARTFTSLILTFEALNEVEARRTMACVAGAIRPLVEDVNLF